jgi:arsenate reductase
MSTAKLFHNPGCSKSRAALELVKATGADVEVVQYLKAPPTRDELVAIVAGLDGEAIELVRVKDKKFVALGIDASSLDSPETVIDVLATHPEVMERPVLFDGTRAAIGRPLDRIEAILPS